MLHPKAMEYVINFDAKDIIYVSCNPKSLVTDLKVLKASGYEIKKVVLMDMFRHTPQDESRSISENSTWGIRRRYEQGKVSVNYTKFLGYDKGEDGNLVINGKQAKIVRRIYTDYLDGKGSNRIARELEDEGILNWNGKAKWYESSIRKMLSNEKYKGDGASCKR